MHLGRFLYFSQKVAGVTLIWLIFGRDIKVSTKNLALEICEDRPKTSQIKRFMDQNLSWLIVNLKQFQL